MSIIALSYHVFHAKTSRHVSYLRKGKNVAPRQGSSRGPARLELNECKRLDASVLFPLTHPRPQSTIGITKNKRSAAQQNLHVFRHILQPLVCYCQNHTWKIVNNSSSIFVENVVYFKNCVNFSRAVSTRFASVVCYDRSGFRARTGVSAKGGKMQRGGKEGHRCQREFRRCGTLSPPCW